MHGDRTQRLLDLVLGGEASLVILHGPPMAGRTTALRQWIASRDGLDATWHRQPSRLSSPELAEALTQLDTPRDTAAPRRLVVVRAAREADLPATRKIALAAGRAGAQCAVIADCPTGLEDVRADALLIGPDQFAVTPEECAALARSRGIDAEPGDVQWLHDLTGGWRGLVLAHLGSLTWGQRLGPAPAGTHAIGSRVAQLVDAPALLQLGPLVDALALGARPTSECFETLPGGATQCHSAARQLVASGLATWDGTCSPSRLRMIPAVATHLASLLAGRPERIERAHGIASRLAERAGEPLEAARLALGAQEVELGLSLLDANWMAAAYLGREAFEPVLASLGPDASKGRPGVRVLRALWGLAPLGRHEHPRPTSGVNRRGPRGDRAQATAKVRAAMLATAELRLHGDLRGAVNSAQRQVTLLDSLVQEHHDPPPALTAYARLQAGETALLAGATGRARHWLTKAWHSGTRTGTRAVERTAAVQLALLCATDAEPTAARHWLTVSAGSPRVGGAHEALLDHLVGLSQLITDLDTVELAAAKQHLHHAHALVDHRELWSFALSSLVRFHVMSGQPDVAASAVADRFAVLLSQGAQVHTDGLALLHRLTVTCELARGSLRGARDAVEAMSGLNGPVAALAELSVALASAEFGRARRLAEPHLTGVDIPLRLRHLLRGGWAAASAALGHHGQAQSEILSLTSSIRKSGAIGLLLDLPPVVLGSLEGVPAWRKVRERLRTSGARSAFDALPPAIRLTERERRILAGFRTGATLEEIATELFVSVNTIKTQTRGLYRKLDVTSRSSALAQAVSRGLL